MNYSNESQKSNSLPISVILGGYVNGLGLIRSFGYKKIPTLVLDKRKTFSFYSKYTIGKICPCPENEEQAFINYLIELGKNLPNKGVLFATNDIWLIPISKHRGELSPYYYYPMSEWEIIEKCWNKNYLYPIAEANGIPIPKTFFVDNADKLKKISHEIMYPCIVKPSETIGFLEKLKANGRAIVIARYDELIFWVQRIHHAGLGDVPLIVQEQVEGPPTNLYTITSFADRNSEIVAYSIGYKIRQYPPDAGTITAGRIYDEPRVFELGKKLIKSLGYYGISNIEFKKDIRDDTFKLIEINPRPGMWNYSALMSGINLPYLAYCDVLQKKYFQPVPQYPSNGIWVFIPADLINAIYMNRKMGYSEFTLTFKQWFRSIKGRKIFAVESLDDPMPGLYHWANFLIGIVGAIIKGEKSKECNLR